MQEEPREGKREAGAVAGVHDPETPRPTTTAESNRDIWEFFSHPLHQIREALYTLPVRELGALKHIDKADSNQAASVISILQERLTFFRYLTDRDGSFSFRTFIRDEADRRNLFLMNIRQYDAIFRPLMTFVASLPSLRRAVHGEPARLFLFAARLFRATMASGARHAGGS